MKDLNQIRKEKEENNKWRKNCKAKKDHLGIPEILDDIREIYKEMAIKKKVEKVNKKMNQILELIQDTVGSLEKKEAERDSIRILIKKKKEIIITKKNRNPGP